MSKYTGISITEYNTKYRNQIVLMANNATTHYYKKILSDLRWLDTLLVISDGVVQGLIAYSINSIGDTKIGYIYYLLTQRNDGKIAELLLREVEKKLVSKNACMIVAVARDNKSHLLRRGYKLVDKAYLEKITPGVADKAPNGSPVAIKIVEECRKYHIPRSLTRFL